LATPQFFPPYQRALSFGTYRDARLSEREEHDFFAWLRKLTVARLQMTDEDLFVSAACGAIEAARAGYLPW